MASRRELKKAIDNISALVISDAFSCLSVNKNKEKSEEIIDVINETLALRNDMIARVSHVDARNDAKKVRSFFKALKHEFAQGVETEFKKLSEVVKETPAK